MTSLSDKFGMESYQSEEPHVANIGKDNMFFEVVQASYEWNIIDGSELNTEDEISKEFVANTLVKAVGLKDVSDMSSEEIAKYANENGYITFKYRGEKDNNKLVSKTEAEELPGSAQSPAYTGQKPKAATAFFLCCFVPSFSAFLLCKIRFHCSIPLLGIQPNRQCAETPRTGISHPGRRGYREPAGFCRFFRL